MDYSIKKLGSNDIAFAQELIKLWKDEDGILNPEIPDEKYLKKLLLKDSFHAFVAIINNKIVGGITAYELEMFDKQETEMFLYEIGVDEHHRQKGIAKALINELKKVCVEKEINIMFVGSSLDNSQAKKSYLSTGGEMEEIPWFTYELMNKD